MTEANLVFTNCCLVDVDRFAKRAVCCLCTVFAGAQSLKQVVSVS